ncbi:hypothetical protein Q7A_2155 [Methylophaga nitratireducenticrescens]|uniref:Type I restriction-modification system, specificity subunit S n=1 Tax=Methylophaga nitratireducenticrescens TaxID=754476 RepID=I1XKQ0_METNJ|nr:restriction endonuclease subunit S [Methylophaga nitratireducenticrescens]AFI84969.1 hypothetical protein Q7A_2155 [Methylophaga nitratireducenticrescens]
MITTSKKLIPELRFPEFSNQWVEEKTSYFLKRVNNPVNVLKDKEYREIGVRSHGKGIFHKKIINGKELGDKRVFWVEVPAFLVNIVFAWEQAVAVTSLAEKGFIASHRFPMFVPNNQRSDLNFVKYFFFRPRGKYLLELASPGGAGRNKTLGQNDFAKLKVVFPKIEEQQKIAEFLSAVDDKLTNLRRKHELLEIYKRGLMQQLFSQQIRFKQDDGSDFSGWEVFKLKFIFERIKNGTSTEQLDGSVGVKITRIETISSGEIDLLKVGHAKYNDSLNDYKMCKGDILFSNINSVKQIGKVAYYNMDEDLYHGMNLLLLRTRKKLFNPRMIFELLKTSKLKNRFEKICNKAVNQASINQTELGKEEVFIPTDINEQQKIADFLQSIDNKIEAVAKQITQLDTFKKGLLQKLFV